MNFSTINDVGARSAAELPSVSRKKSVVKIRDFSLSSVTDVVEFLGCLWVSSRTSGWGSERGFAVLQPEKSVSRTGSGTYVSDSSAQDFGQQFALPKFAGGPGEGP
jgi:hypothetical protein